MTLFPLFMQLRIEDGEEVIEEMYPATGPDAYDPLRTKEPEPAPGAINPSTGLPAAPPEAAPAQQREAAT